MAARILVWRGRTGLLGEGLPDHVRPTVRSTRRTAAIWLVLWFVLVGVLLAAFGPDQVFGQIAFFFSEIAAVTFGPSTLCSPTSPTKRSSATIGAGVADPRRAGMAETTPGPLVMVTQFVSFEA
jgi:chromate transporter